MPQHKGCPLVFYKHKSREKGLASLNPSVGKTSDNVTVAEVFAINNKLKNSCEEKNKKTNFLPSKVIDEVVKYAHRYGTQAAIAHFREKYQQYTLKHTS